jgi:hypothetical protein
MVICDGGEGLKVMISFLGTRFKLRRLATTWSRSTATDSCDKGRSSHRRGQLSLRRRINAAATVFLSTCYPIEH